MTITPEISVAIAFVIFVILVYKSLKVISKLFASFLQASFLLHAVRGWRRNGSVAKSREALTRFACLLGAAGGAGCVFVIGS